MFNIQMFEELARKTILKEAIGAGMTPLVKKSLVQKLVELDSESIFKSNLTLIFDKINFTASIDDCWNWTGFCQPTGYGHYNMFNGEIKTWMAHRALYYIFNTDFDPDLDVCHSCDNPSCVNPFHLWQGTRQQNMTDLVYKKGHPNRTLDKEDVIAIFLSPDNYETLAVRYLTCHNVITNIKTKRYYREITEALVRPDTGRIYKRLTPQEVVEIFLDPRSQGQIAKSYGIHQGNVSQIKNQKAYSELTEDLDVGSGKPVRI